MVVPKHLCRCENLALLKENERIEIADEQCWRAIAGYTLYDHRTNKITVNSRCKEAKID
jgi:hypothetical protein